MIEVKRPGDDRIAKGCSLFAELNTMLADKEITFLTYRTIAGQIGMGDIKAARKGIRKLKLRAEREKNNEISKHS